jgi:acetoacetyl-CoA synthetase
MDMSEAPKKKVSEGELLWTPRPEFARGSNVSKYMDWLRSNRGKDFSDYDALRQWSVTDIEDFWASIWDYFKIESSTPYKQVLDRRIMPGAKWFEGSMVNYTEHLLRHERTAKPDEIVFRHLTEGSQMGTMTWHELARQVRILATQLRAMGIKPGDRVVSYMPNVP